MSGADSGENQEFVKTEFDCTDADDRVKTLMELATLRDKTMCALFW